MATWSRLEYRDSGLSIARGIIGEAEAVNIFGFNRNIGNNYETIWNNGGGLYEYPSSAVQMSVVSSDAGDTAQIKIEGLDADYNRISEIVTLTGTTPVTTTQPFLRINSSSVVATPNLTGNVTISNGGTTYGYIEGELGTHQGCFYTVPADYSLFIYRIDVNCGTVDTNKTIFIRNNLQFPSGVEYNVAEASFNASQVSYDRQIPFRIGEKTDFSFRAKSASSTNEVSIFVEAVLVKD
jgi:hypothetical protein